MTFQFTQINPDSIAPYLASAPGLHDNLLRIAKVLEADFGLVTAQAKHVAYQEGDDSLVIETWVPGTTKEVLDAQHRFDALWEGRKLPPLHGIVVRFRARDWAQNRERSLADHAARRRAFLDDMLGALLPLGEPVTPAMRAAVVEALVPHTHLLGAEPVPERRP